MRRISIGLVVFVLLSLPSLVAARGEGILEVTGNADGAAVFIDGTLVGSIPLTELVAAGRHLVRVEHPSFAPWEREVVVDADTSVSLAARLDRVRAGLNIRVDVPGARILLDGRQVGVGDVTVDPVRAGRHTLVVETDDYGRFEKIIQVPEARLSLVEVPIRGSVGSLSVATEPPGARVFLDGKERGRAPLAIPSLAPGDHGLQITGEGRAMVLESVSIGPGESRSLSYDLSAEGGYLNLRMKPEQAEVSINGVGFRAGSKSIGPLQPGSYSIRITASGYLDFLQTVEIEADRSVKVVARLQAFDLSGSGVAGGPVAPRSSVPVHRRPEFWVGVGAGGAAVVTAIIIGAVRASQTTEPVPGTPAPPATFTFSLP